MEEQKKVLLSLLCALILVTFIYIFLHELGHTLVAMACGTKITGFSIMKANMSYVGGNFNQVTKSLFNVAGMLLPVLVCLIFILTFNGNKKSMLYIWFSVMFFMASTFSILAWVIVPFVSMFSTPPAGDDVTKFLINSGCNKFIIILSAMLLIGMMVIIALYKGVFKSFLDLRNKISKHEKNTPV